MNKYKSLQPFFIEDINAEFINLEYLSANPSQVAMDILRIHPDRVNKGIISQNESKWAIQYLKENPHKIHWGYFSANPSAISLIEKYPSKACPSIYSNPKASHLWDLSLISWRELSANPSDNAMQIIRNHPQNIVWSALSSNPSKVALDLMKENMNKINWGELCFNPSKEALELLEANPNKINWINLSQNPAAIDILKRNEDMLCQHNFQLNPHAVDMFLDIYNSTHIIPRINYITISKNKSPNAMKLFTLCGLDNFILKYGTEMQYCEGLHGHADIFMRP